MNLSNLKYAQGSRKNSKRLGRGHGSGTGATSGRGHKGYGSRSGSKSGLKMEGGQIPYFKRFPKRGFTNIFRTEYQVVNLDRLNHLEAKTIDIDTLHSLGLIRYQNKPVKILGDGDISSEKEIFANAFSKSAISKIEAAGGKAVIV
ncbi:MAG: 50S ribosomal protein L15 [Candidatus Marinimicrobia bacterium]|nr:50S ribosomal protein L15 [Candidatus Neomarinimicrobiota bacterium]